MKPKRSNPLFSRFICRNAFASAIVVSLVGSANAAEIAYRTAATSTAEVTLAANWGNGTVVPGASDIAAWTTAGFNGQSRGGTFTVGSPVTWNGIGAEDAVGSIILTGSPITLGASGIAEVRWELFTIENPVVLSADQSWNISGQTTTVTAGGVTGAFTLTKTGAATLNLGSLASGLVVTAGTVNASGTIGGAVNVTGGRFNALAASMGGSLTVGDAGTVSGATAFTGNITLGATGGAKIIADSSAPAGLSTLGNLTLNGVTEISVNGQWPVATPIPVVTYTGTLTDTGTPGDVTDNFSVANPGNYRSTTVSLVGKTV